VVGNQPALPAASHPAVIDTIILDRQDVFPEEASGFLARSMNSLHIKTRPWVIRSELLLREGDTFDQRLAEESERNLRARFLFSEVAIDTTRLDTGGLAVTVRTQDAWSTSPKVSFSVAADGSTKAILGITESNLVGTGARIQLWYRKDVDRDGADLATEFPRAFGSPLFIAGSYKGLTDQNLGDWRLGLPFFSNSQRFSVEYDGEAFDGRVFRFRTVDAAAPDTTFFFRRALINRLTITGAAIGNPRRYLRVGLTGEVRQEAILLADDSLGLVPDTLYGEIGVFAEFRESAFEVVRHFNSFGEEDLDLSEVVALTATLAPSVWGYESTGFGPKLSLATGGRVGQTILKGSLMANALFNSAGLDSGRVVVSGVAGITPAPRHATFFRIEGGVQKDPAPATEFELGFSIPPRLWVPHAFTGDRSFAATLEHRWFVWDEVLDLVGIGFGAFADYGGAWFEDQDRRLGGNVGLSIIFGSAIGGRVETGSLSFGLRFGDELEGDRFAVGLLSGIVF
jgi:hypothetical protein